MKKKKKHKKKNNKAEKCGERSWRSQSEEKGLGGQQPQIKALGGGDNTGFNHPGEQREVSSNTGKIISISRQPDKEVCGREMTNN